MRPALVHEDAEVGRGVAGIDAATCEGAVDSPGLGAVEGAGAHPLVSTSASEMSVASTRRTGYLWGPPGKVPSPFMTRPASTSRRRRS
jgi:hypothetical protein